MKNVIAIRREDLSKRGEKRVAVVPELARKIVAAGSELIVQPRKHPISGEVKRAFEDFDYKASGANVQEDISAARVIFGLKEVDVDHVLPEKAYLLFSHTHKGQIKNRKLLATFVRGKNTVIDYELITDENNARIITAFTYFAGYAGMIDTLWAYGKRLAALGKEHPFQKVPQSIETEDLKRIKDILKFVGNKITAEGTPADQPPMICTILGNGKTSTGAQEIYDILPIESIRPDQIKEIYQSGSRNKVYKLVLDIHEMFRMKKTSSVTQEAFDAMTVQEKQQLYFNQPDLFTSNLDQFLPYTSILMNCILWAPEFPRVLTDDLMADIQTLGVLHAIGDITCDPNGSIEFSKETWIDNPVYVYDAHRSAMADGFHGDGVAVMAVTNLPCEFSADASAQFSENLAPLLEGIISADYDGPIESAALPDAIKKAVILWNGEFTEEYDYMKEFLLPEQHNFS